MSCMIQGCQIRTVNNDEGLIAYHHVRELGGGGTAMKPSDYQTVPLCAHHHRLWHQKGMLALNLDIESILHTINGQLIDYIEQLKEGAQ